MAGQIQRFRPTASFGQDEGKQQQISMDQKRKAHVQQYGNAWKMKELQIATSKRSFSPDSEKEGELDIFGSWMGNSIEDNDFEHEQKHNFDRAAGQQDSAFSNRDNVEIPKAAKTAMKNIGIAILAFKVAKPMMKQSKYNVISQQVNQLIRYIKKNLREGVISSQQANEIVSKTNNQLQMAKLINNGSHASSLSSLQRWLKNVLKTRKR